MTLRTVEIDWAATGLPPVECPESPERLAGMPLGMYHCPHCGCMQLAGIEHLPHELSCWLGLWDGEPDG